MMKSRTRNARSRSARPAAGLLTAYAVALAVVLAAVPVFSACTAEDGGNADTNTVKETTTDRVPGGTNTQAVTDNVHDNQTDPGTGNDPTPNDTTGNDIVPDVTVPDVTVPDGTGVVTGIPETDGSHSAARRMIPRW